jgi:hypothetical protein
MGRIVPVLKLKEKLVSEECQSMMNEMLNLTLNIGFKEFFVVKSSKQQKLHNFGLSKKWWRKFMNKKRRL